MRFAVAFTALLLVATPLAQAASAAPAVAEAQADKDRKIVQKAMNSNDLKTIRAMVPALEDVASRTPSSYPLVEQKDGFIVVRATSPDQGMVPSLIAGMTGKGDKPNASSRVDIEYNTYGTALFLLGSAAVEARDMKKAAYWLDKGLALQPDNLMLVTEKGMVLTVQRRHADALALYDATFENASGVLLGDQQGKARLLRAKGFSLIELNRLEEAEAAYRASLEIEPDHGGAKHELAYITKLRAGGEQLGMKLVNGEESKAVK
ncbi:MAG: tetratricopeptide repeat protein [Caulobacter sp.]